MGSFSSKATWELKIIILSKCPSNTKQREFTQNWIRLEETMEEYVGSNNKFPISGDGRLTVNDIPGPKPSLPILGTRWIFSGLGPYRMNKIHEAYKDMFQKYGKVVKEESLWNFPVISVVDLKSIEEVLNQHSKYPLRPPTEVTVHYRKSRPDRYSNLGLVNE